MRKTMGALLASVLLLGSGALLRSGEDEDGRAIIAKAIKAAGGADNLAKHKSATFKGKGTYYGMGEGLPYAGNYAFQWPDKFRMEIENVFTIVLDGDKGWIKEGDTTKDMTKEQLTQQLQDQKAGWVTTLLPLTDKAFQVKAIGEAKVDKHDALGVKVTRKDYPEVKLYFDKKSGLLLKSTFRTKSPEQKFKEVTQDNYYYQYRDVDGAKLPTKMVIKRDDKLFVEEEVSDYKAGKVDRKLFAKP
ncbi:MAG TPA: hypothetical protein VKE98_22765 [Gemmataceae bacterium]|nr:hypothetical protein [Gemmataceae bacterium]